jgi:DNA-binding NtrC family response regulator
VSCATLPEHLAEEELMGGRDDTRVGQLEAATGGTLFLDEVGALSPAVQTMLLRVLESRRVRRTGDGKEREVDVRVIAASQRDLQSDAVHGRFRLDLYYRLSAATARIPPLRERLGEVPVLAQLFLDEACRSSGREPKRLAPETIEALLAHSFPGNVRELRNMMRYAAATCVERLVRPEWLPPHAPPGAPEPQPAPTPQPIGATLKEIERRRMADALAACDGNQTRAAELIGMPRRTFVAKLKQYGLGRPRDEG